MSLDSNSPSVASNESRAIERLPVSPDTVNVLGHRVKATDPMWTGLNLDKAEPRTQNTLMLAVCGQEEAPEDIHLAVPWCHPEDRANGAEEDCIYRIRPKMEAGKRWKGRMVKSVAFERWDGRWVIAVRYAKPRNLIGARER